MSQKLISTTELKKSVTDKLNKSGVTISEEVVGMVIDAYQNGMKDELLTNHRVHLGPIGQLIPYTRKVNEAVGKSNYGFTAKVKVDLDYTLKEQLKEYYHTNKED